MIEDINEGIFPGYAPSAQELAMEKARARLFSITRISRNKDGKAFAVYFSNGTKITIGRDATGAAWLDIGEQEIIKPL